MYAPIDYDRSLYIFCCNKRACSLTSKGWIVIRNQQQQQQFKSTIGNTNEQKIDVFSSLIPVTNATADKFKIEKAVTPSIPTTSTTTKSAWGSLMDYKEEEVDMMLLLEARDKALALKTTGARTSSSSSSNPKKIVLKQAIRQVESITSPAPFVRPALLPPSLVCWKVDAIIDPCPFSTEMLTTNAREGDGEDEDDHITAPFSMEAMKHVHEMLAGYVAASEIEGEGEDKGGDDPALLEILKKEVLLNERGGKGKETSAYNSKIDTHAQVAKSSIPRDTSTNDNKRERDGGNDLLLSKVDYRCKVESMFQASVSYAPSQVVRFAYGGLPLWCSHPYPADASVSAIPKCDCCGAQRVFEMQLMPGNNCLSRDCSGR